jgi:hypothetical protein
MTDAPARVVRNADLIAAKLAAAGCTHAFGIPTPLPAPASASP